MSLCGKEKALRQKVKETVTPRDVQQHFQVQKFQFQNYFRGLFVRCVSTYAYVSVAIADFNI